MYRSLTLVLAIAVAGCSAAESSAPSSADRAASPDPQTLAGTYVLTDWTAITGPAFSVHGAPFARSDTRCGANGDHQQELVLGDTVVISADGSMQWNISSADYLNGAPESTSRDSFSGFFGSFNGSGMVFFDGHPTFTMTIILHPGGQADQIATSNRNFRVETDGSISTLDGVGVHCGPQGGVGMLQQDLSVRYYKIHS